MLSLADVFSIEEVEDFVQGVKRFLNTAENIPFMEELKIDGLSFTARYENGRFVSGATRGEFRSANGRRRRSFLQNYRNGVFR